MSTHHPFDPSAAQEGLLPVGHSRLYYRDLGHGQPLFLLHGGPSFSHSYLLPDMDRLADAFRLIYYDQRGRGKSAGDVDPTAVSMQSEVDDLEYALRHPARVSHLVLLNTAPASHDDCVLFEQQRDGQAPADAALLLELEASPAYAQGDLEARAAANRVYFRATLQSPELLDRLIEHLQTGWTKEDVLTARAIGKQLWDETYGSTRYDLLPKLTRLRIPTLILHGDYDFVPLACAAHIAEAMPAAQLVVLQDCGHFSYLERPDAVRQTLNAFFARQFSSTEGAHRLGS